jgi:predicted HicB family RNase H-like nuclease
MAREMPEPATFKVSAVTAREKPRRWSVSNPDLDFDLGIIGNSRTGKKVQEWHRDSGTPCDRFASLDLFSKPSDGGHAGRFRPNEGLEIGGQEDEYLEALKMFDSHEILPSGVLEFTHLKGRNFVISEQSFVVYATYCFINHAFFEPINKQAHNKLFGSYIYYLHKYLFNNIIANLYERVCYIGNTKYEKIADYILYNIDSKDSSKAQYINFINSNFERRVLFDGNRIILTKSNKTRPSVSYRGKSRKNPSKPRDAEENRPTERVDVRVSSVFLAAVGEAAHEADVDRNTWIKRVLRSYLNNSELVSPPDYARFSNDRTMAIRVETRLLNDIDAAAAASGLSRSGWIKRVVTNSLTKQLLQSSAPSLNSM